MPNTNVFRPADACEMTSALILAFEEKNNPTVIVSTRQNMPNLDCTNFNGVQRGAYIAYEANSNPDAFVITCGSELTLCIEAAKKLAEEGKNIRVVSMPSMFLFDKQPDEYKESILPSSISKRLAVEMGSSMPWYKYAKNVHGIDTFGASMPISQIYGEYGFTVDVICNDIKEIL
jgi:transketolase